MSISAYDQLKNALRFSNVDKVRQLIPLCDPKKDDSSALRMAAYYGNTECVELLIPVSDPKALDSQALMFAASEGYVDCVKLLIPVSDPATNQSRALVRAITRGHNACAQLLYDVSDLEVVLGVIEEGYDLLGTQIFQDLKQRVTIQREHALLKNATHHNGVERKNKKM